MLPFSLMAWYSFALNSIKYTIFHLTRVKQLPIYSIQQTRHGSGERSQSQYKILSPLSVFGLTCVVQGGNYLR